MSAKYPYTDFHELNDDILIARVQNLKEHVKEQDVRIDDIIHNIPDVNDYYDKDEVDDLLDDKADKSNTYTKTEVNNLLDDKVDDTELNNYYTKTETDDLLDDKVDTTDLATVAFSGDYDDLSNKPTIPPAQVNSDWNATSGVAEILNKPTIPDVSNFYTKTETNTLLNGKENSLGSGEIGEVLTQVSSNIKSWVEPHYMPPGGTSGQVLTKASNDNYAAIWDDMSADQITYDNTTSGITATDVQGALDEIDNSIDNLIKIIKTSISGGTTRSFQFSESSCLIYFKRSALYIDCLISLDYWADTYTVLFGTMPSGLSITKSTLSRSFSITSSLNNAVTVIIV